MGIICLVLLRARVNLRGFFLVQAEAMSTGDVIDTVLLYSFLRGSIKS
jgi:hypothetical protein